LIIVNSREVEKPHSGFAFPGHKNMVETQLVDTEEEPPGTGRIETFSDSVVAIIITIMVLELKLPANLC
jgi:hypothetical protein